MRFACDIADERLSSDLPARYSIDSGARGCAIEKRALQSREHQQEQELAVNHFSIAHKGLIGLPSSSTLL